MLKGANKQPCQLVVSNTSRKVRCYNLSPSSQNEGLLSSSGKGFELRVTSALATFEVVVRSPLESLKIIMDRTSRV